MTVFMTADRPECIVVQCSCVLPEHEFCVTWMDDFNEFAFIVRLHTWGNVFRRAWSAFLYVIGHKSRYGEFDEILVDKRDAKKIAAFLLRYAEKD